MQTYILSEKDRWFLNKRRIDSLSRSQFSVGDSIVVCDKKHVMLSEYYEGSCHSCNSFTTVPFSYANVEHGYKLTDADSWHISKNPIDRLSKKEFAVGDTVVVCGNKHMTLISSYNGICPICGCETIGSIPIKKEPFAWFISAKMVRALLPNVNKALGWSLGVLAIILIFLVITGLISHEQLYSQIQTGALPKTKLIFTEIKCFAVSSSVNTSLIQNSNIIFTMSGVLLNNMLAVVMSLVSGLLFFFTNIGRFVFLTDVNISIENTKRIIFNRHEILFTNMLTTIVILAYGLKDITICLLEMIHTKFYKTKSLLELFEVRTRSVIDMIIN